MKNMESHEFDRMRQVEDDYWWYRGLRGLVARKAKQALSGVSSPRVLDAGCGTGGMLTVLRRELADAALTGVDVDPKALEFSRARGAGTVVAASVEKLPFEPETFDLAVSLDVLYIDSVNDVAAAGEIARVLKKGGTLIINLPAFEVLRGEHDRAVHTARRYTKKSLRVLLEGAGFSTVEMFYWNSALFPFLLVWRPLTRLFSAHKTRVTSDLKPLPRLIDRFLGGFICGEIKLDEHVPFPAGSSLFAVAKK